MATLTEAKITKKLRLLWKGTLFIGITGIYILIVGVLFMYRGWLPSLLAVFFIGLGQFFRYIFNDIDRMGWNISALEKDKINPTTKKYQKRMLYLLGSLVQITNIALIIQVYVLYGFVFSICTLAGLFIVELLYLQIRTTNKKVGYEQACYGFRDKGVVFEGADIVTPEIEVPKKKKRHISLEEKLNKLKKMSEIGEISQRAYEEIRDQRLIQKVMDQNEIEEG